MRHDSDHLLAAPVVLAVLTYRRPALLDLLLPVLVAQAADSTEDVAVLVVDNDPAGGAADAVRRWNDRGVTYAHEPRPGIAAARNRALDAAAQAEALVFIDDDEVPEPGWLDQLLTSWRRYSCAAVTGPVVPSFRTPPERWITASRAFDRRRLASGTPVRGAASNNLLLDMSTIRELGLTFDESFGLTGGEDTMLTHALVRRGRQILWCDEAEVVGPVAPERATPAYVLRRTFRAGTSWSRVEILLAEGASQRARARADLAARGCARLVRATVQISHGVLRGRLSSRARGTCELASAGGMILGAVGVTYREYRRKD